MKIINPIVQLLQVVKEKKSQKLAELEPAAN